MCYNLILEMFQESATSSFDSIPESTRTHDGGRKSNMLRQASKTV